MTPIQRRFDAIYEIGCICCRKLGKLRIPCQAHHLNLGGMAGQKRRGDLFTIGLCPWHHAGEYPNGHTEDGMLEEFGPSYKLHSRRFREKFGNDDALLVYQDNLIDERRRAA